jgi:putative Ca2+/H+ antiporter (TMEM165/GDT1 family)
MARPRLKGGMKRHHVRRTLLFIFGALFIAFGIGAFFGVPGAHDRDHHQVGHNLTHIVAGLITLYVAWVGDSGTRRSFCFAFGAIYLAVGLFGVFSVKDSLRVIPGLLEFHLEDTWVQMGTGLLFFVLGLLKKVPSRSPRRAWAA